MINVHTVVVTKPATERPHGRHKLRWDDDTIKMDIKEIEFEGMEWIHLSQDGAHWQAVLNAVMNYCVA
jgi:hypothetical protein